MRDDENEANRHHGDDATAKNNLRFQEEIDRLHHFFVQWFTGSMEDTAENLRLADEAMDPSFHLINPQGNITNKVALMKAFQDGAYGCRKGQVFEITCRNVQVLQRKQDEGTKINTYLCCYEEWQTIGKIETARIVSAWFREEEDDSSSSSSSKLIWLHVHETWLPGKAPPTEKEMWKPDGE